ncbi:MAG: HDOD domain-containing protein [Thiobacillaceae bacterium]|jgi:EAL and modified HD-GYP domain-containing signal transduction protein|nr:HDOD domain-containing protein [Thiobacillaceae bacterium]
MPITQNLSPAPEPLRHVPGIGGPRHPEEDARVALPRFLTRQPLLDREYRVVGHELMINGHTPLPVLPGATSLRQIEDEILLVGVLDLNDRQAMHKRLSLFKLPMSALEHPLLDRLPREGTLLAVRPDAADTEGLARCQALARQGLGLVLDEVEPSPALLPLIRDSRYLRLDISGAEPCRLRDRVRHLRAAGASRLIASNVETEEAFEACRKLAFDLFQGHFYTQPRPAGPHRIDTSRLRIMELLNLVTSRAEYARIEAQFKLDAGLTMRLLRYINSPGVGLRYPIRSIGHALLMLGHDTLYRWLTLLLFSHERGDQRSQALLRNALVRARFAELLSQERLAPASRDGLFITGILSMLDALLNVPMAEAIASLKLVQPIVDALLRGEGIYAPYLMLAMACESDDPMEIARLSAVLDLAPDEVNLAHLNALIWSETLGQ